MQVGELLVKIGTDLSGLQKGLEQAKTQISSVGANIQSAFERAMPASKTLLAGVSAVGAGMIATGVKAISMAGQIEQSKIAFTTLLGSAKDADSFLRKLYDFSAKTPFEFQGLQDASRQLLAFGFQSQQIIPMMTAIGNAVAGLGGGAAEIDRVTRALGQMQAKGKVSAEEMMQLAELGIPAWEILAQKIGVDIPTAMKMAEQGAIPAAQAIEGLIAGMNERFPNMMQQQSQTLFGMWSTLKDNLSLIFVSIGEELIKALDLKDKLKGIIDALDKFASTIKEKGLKKAIEEIFPPDLQLKIAMIAGAIAGALVPALGALAVAVWGAITPLIPFMAAGAALGALAYVIVKKWDTVKEFFAKIGDLWNNVKEKTEEVWGSIKSFLEGLWNNLKQTVENVWKTIVGTLSVLWNNLKASASSIWNAIKAVIQNPIQEIKTWMGQAWNNIKSTLSNLWNSVKENATTAWNNVKSAITSPIEKAKETLMGIIEKIKSAFAKMKITIPKPKLPHISVEIKYKSVGNIKIPYPDFDINWYAKGGIFDSPSIIGVGEAGSEVVAPLDKLTVMIVDALKQALPQVQAAGVGGIGDIYVYIGNDQVDAYIYRSQERRNIRSNGR